MFLDKSTNCSVIVFSITQSKWCQLLSNLKLNKKVLLRERKRHTACRVAITPSVVISWVTPPPRRLDLTPPGWTWPPLLAGPDPPTPLLAGPDPPPLAGPDPPPPGWTWPPLAGWTWPPPTCGQTDWWTDTCQNITFPRTTYAGGNESLKNSKAVSTTNHWLGILRLIYTIWRWQQKRLKRLREQRSDTPVSVDCFNIIVDIVRNSFLSYVAFAPALAQRDKFLKGCLNSVENTRVFSL